MNRVTLDPLVIHSQDLGDVVGDFYGTSIRSWYPEATETHDRENTRRIVIENKQREVKQ